MPSPVTGLHHVSAISGPAQQNVDFFAGLLGLRFVKQTVNFDDPGTYHLYYADGPVRPGSFLTFFPWDDGQRGRAGGGQTTATAYAVRPDAVDAWMDRFAAAGHDAFDAPTERFGDRVLTLRDPDGIVIELVETPDADGQWTDGPIPEDEALGAFHSVTLASLDPQATARVLADAYGYEEHGQEGDRLRLVNPAAERARFVDLDLTDHERGRMGVGTVHHIAFRVPDDEGEMAVRETLLGLGLQPTPQVDRQYFRSVYTREPGGLLFELATDPPGFAVDEPEDQLGRSLQLPPQYEGMRERIEARLPPLVLPR